MPQDYKGRSMDKEGTDYTLTIQMINNKKYNIKHISNFKNIKESFKTFVRMIYDDKGIYHFDRSTQKCTYIPLQSIIYMECSLED